jgi:hypothetical protein
MNNEKEEKINENTIQEILNRGNTAEVKQTKRGIVILEVKRKIRYENNDDVQKQNK